MKTRKKICGSLTTGIKILKRLSEPFKLDVKVWKNGELIQTFHHPDVKSRKIDLEYRPIGRNHGRWYLGKRRKKKGCLLRLLAEEVKKSPRALKDTLQTYQPLNNELYNPTRGVSGAGELLNKSHGSVSVDGKMCHPRRSASYGVYGRQMSRGDLTFPKCVDAHSKKIGHHGFLMGFTSFNQQSYFLHEVMLSSETQGTLKHLMSRGDPYAWVRQVLPIESFHGTLSDVKGTQVSSIGSIFYGGEKIGEAPIEFVSLTLKHPKPTEFQNTPKILVHDFYPMLFRFDNPQHIFQGSSKNEVGACPQKKPSNKKSKTKSETNQKRNCCQNSDRSTRKTRKTPKK